MALDSVISRQGSIIAYSDDFKLMFILTAIIMPLVFFIRSPCQTQIGNRRVGSIGRNCRPRSRNGKHRL